MLAINVSLGQESTCSKIKNKYFSIENEMDAAANLLFGKTRQAVLVLLFEQAGQSSYLREIARATGIGPGQLQNELQQLCKADLVVRREDGNRVTYQANTRHPIFAELQSIVSKTCGLPARIKAALMPLAAGIQFAAIYGSFAKGSNNARSNVDLLIVGEPSLETIISLIHPIEQKSGREISVRLYTKEAFAERKAKGDSFLSGILNGPLMPLLPPPNGAMDESMASTVSSLAQSSEAYLRNIFLAKLPQGTRVYLFGSRARGDARWNSDYDFWIDGSVDRKTLLEIEEALEESFVPFNVDLVTTAQLNGRFGEIVKQEAKPWL